MLARLEHQGAQHLVGAARVLDEQNPQLAAGRVLFARGLARRDREALRAPEGRLHALQPRQDVLQGDSERTCERCRSERVVDVVEPRQSQRDLSLAVNGAQGEPCGSHAFEPDPRRSERRVGAPLAAPRAVVAAEMAEVDGVEDIRCAASAAVLGVGCVGHTGQGKRVVFDPVVERVGALAAEIGNQWVVGVQHEPLPAVDLRPALADRLELAVAVELIAK